MLTPHLTLFVCFLMLFSFFLFPFTSVWENILVWVPISYSHTECYLFFSDSATTSVQCVFRVNKYNYFCPSNPIPTNKTLPCHNYYRTRADPWNIFSLSLICCKKSNINNRIIFGRETGPRERNSLVWRGKIIGLHLSGQSIVTISRTLGMHQTTVARWIKRHNEEGDMTTRPKAGRPKITTATEDQQLVDRSRANSKTTAVSLHLEA